MFTTINYKTRTILGPHLEKEETTLDYYSLPHNSFRNYVKPTLIIIDKCCPF